MKIYTQSKFTPYKIKKRKKPRSPIGDLIKGYSTNSHTVEQEAQVIINELEDYETEKNK